MYLEAKIKKRVFLKFLYNLENAMKEFVKQFIEKLYLS